MTDQAVTTTFPPMAPEREAAVMQGLSIYQRVAGENDVLKAQVDGQAQTNRLLELEIEELRRQLHEEVCKRLAAEHARDLAIEARAELEALFAGVGAMLERFSVASKPLKAKGSKRLPEAMQLPTNGSNGAEHHAS